MSEDKEKLTELENRISDLECSVEKLRNLKIEFEKTENSQWKNIFTWKDTIRFYCILCAPSIAIAIVLLMVAIRIAIS